MTGSISHILCFSQSVVEPTLNPFWATNHCSNCSLPCSHRRKSFASFWFLEYFMIAWDWFRNSRYAPAGPAGSGAWSMSWNIGSPLSSLIFSFWRLATM